MLILCDFDVHSPSFFPLDPFIGCLCSGALPLAFGFVVCFSRSIHFPGDPFCPLTGDAGDRLISLLPFLIIRRVIRAGVSL